MDAITIAQRIAIGTRFTIRGRTYTRASGCVSIYSPLSKGGERYTFPAWPFTGGPARVVTVRPTDKIVVDP